MAVPDFSGGAMENWGLVLYRETALLYEPGVSSSENKLMVTLIVAHEVAHTVSTRQWIHHRPHGRIQRGGGFMYRSYSNNCESAYINNVKLLSVTILARIIMVWKLVHLYTPERNSKKNKLGFFNDELFYSIWFG